MELVQIELTNHFTDIAAGTFACKGDRLDAYWDESIGTYTVFDQQYRIHNIPIDRARILTSKYEDVSRHEGK